MKPKRFPDPFALTTDPRSYVPRVSSERALREMEAELAEGTAAVLLAGPPGIGKTLMLHVLAERLEEHFQPVYVPHGRLAAQDLAAFLLGTLGVPPAQDPLAALLGLARSREQHRGQSGLRPLIVLIDDVGGAGIDTLVALTAAGPAPRLVAVPATDEDAGLLRSRLADRATLVSLRQPLSAAESSALVRRRLVHAGLPGSVIGRYDEAAIQELHAAAEGNPMALHALADAWLRRRARPLRPVRAEDTPEPARPELGAREIARASHPPRRAEERLSPLAGAVPSKSTPDEAGPPAAERPTPPPLRAVPTALDPAEKPRQPVEAAVHEPLGSAPPAASPPSAGRPPLEVRRPKAPTASPGPPLVVAPVRSRPFEPRIRVRPRAGEPAARKPIAAFAAGLGGAVALALWLLLGDAGEDPTLELAGNPIAEPLLAESATPTDPTPMESALAVAPVPSANVPERAPVPPQDVPERAPVPPQDVPERAPVPPQDVPELASARFEEDAAASSLPPVSAPPPSRAKLLEARQAAPGGEPAVGTRTAELPSPRTLRTATGSATILREQAAPAELPQGPGRSAEPAGVERDPGAPEPGRVARVVPAPKPPLQEVEIGPTPTVPEAASAAPAPRLEVDPVSAEPEKEVELASAAPRQAVESAPPATAEPVAAVPANVRVHINATPWAEIELDGEPIGLTPLGNVDMTAGEHSFRAIFGDGRVIDRTLTVGTRSRRVTFDRAEATALEAD